MEVIERLSELIKRVSPHEIDGKPGNWYNIAPLGKLLKDSGFEYKGKLKELLSQIEEIEVYEDKTKTIPVAYIRLQKECRHVQTPQNDRVYIPYGISRQSLFEWAYMGDYLETLSQLKEKALDESWSFGDESDGRYPILDNYLRYTFMRLRKENKISYTKDEQWAIFNTGLVDKTFLPIYALFSRNKIPERQLWHFNSFIAEGEKSKKGRMSVVNFPQKPLRAQYFDNPSDLLYIVSESRNELSPNYEHIIIDNIDRLPIALLRDFVSDSIEEKKQRKDFNSDNDYKAYSETYKSELQNKVSQNGIARKLQERFRNAIDMSRNRVLWNYKTAIPTYYPRTGNITLLLPLCLVNDDKVDLALVVSKGDGGYLAETIYPLDWAYKCARLICRPDSDWLTPSSITNLNTEEEND
jgi:hypothetical protein